MTDEVLDALIREALLARYHAEILWLLRRRCLWMLLRDAAGDDR